MNITASNRDLLEAFCGCVYGAHPYHLPENMDKILDHLDKFAWANKDGEGIQDFCLFKFDDAKQFRKAFSEWMMNCLEYRQLNISRKLKDEGVVDIDDERNRGFGFCSTYDKVTEDSKYRDFIDLDALADNVTNRLLDIVDSHCRCWDCKHRINHAPCDDCYIQDLERKHNHYEFGWDLN